MANHKKTPKEIEREHEQAKKTKEDKIKEYLKKYQQTEEFKEKKRQYYLEKVRKEHVSKADCFMNHFENTTGQKIKNKKEIFRMIHDAETTKELRLNHTKLINVIRVK